MTYEYSQFVTEKQLFEFIKEHFVCDLTPPLTKTERYDGYSEMYNMHIELKCRRKHYDDLIIERGKYDSLMLKPNPVYINSTPKGVWGFYLKDQHIEWVEKELPRQTDFSKRENISKEIGMLDVSKGINLITLASELPF